MSAIVNDDLVNIGFNFKSGHIVTNYMHYPEDAKVWGEERILTLTAEYSGKLMLVYPKYQCSLHYHKNKKETFICLAGSGVIQLFGFKRTNGEVCANVEAPQVYNVSIGVHVHVDRCVPHRFMSKKGMVLLEVSTYHDPQDVYRLENSRRIQDVDDE